MMHKRVSPLKLYKTMYKIVKKKIVSYIMWAKKNEIIELITRQEEQDKVENVPNAKGFTVQG